MGKPEKIVPPAISAAANDSSGGNAQNVFIVDDEEGILDIVSRGLQRAGYRTTMFRNGGDFERAVGREVPDLCIMDLALPDLDGVAILNELAQQCYRGRILLMSGHSPQILRSVSRLAEDNNLNIIGCLHKPFTIQSLLDTVAASPAQSPAITSEDVVKAIRANEIVVRYQPIVDLKTDRVTAAEALVRWQHPTEGLLPPVRFLGKLGPAEMSELTLHVMADAFATRDRWREAGVEASFAINMPIATILDPQFTADTMQLVSKHKTDLEGIIFELTETEMVTDHHQLSATLSKLCLRGLRVSVDDFGTGYSSLSRLQRLPIDEVKIDRSFIRHCATHAADRKIVEAVIALAHALEMQVVAEGVETDSARDLLSKLGCDYAQGFLYGHAITAGELSGMILDRESRPAA